MNIIYIDFNQDYEIHSSSGVITLSGDELYERVHSTPQDIKSIYNSLSRVIEEGNDFKAGIVLGQILTKLENIINANKTN